MTRRLVATVAAAAAVAPVACGGTDEEPAAPAVVREGAVVYRDALDDNHGGWFLVDDALAFRGGVYDWSRMPRDARVAALPDAIVGKALPPGVAVSVRSTMREGAALRGVSCRELGPAAQPEPDDWYELGIDGRRAMVRRMQRRSAPKVLAAASVPVPNGRAVRLTAQCVPDEDGGLVLALRLDGREVVRARDADPLPAARGTIVGLPGIFAYQRPDNHGPASLAWDDFVLRRATISTAA
jgi:hypothetical protein